MSNVISEFSIKSIGNINTLDELVSKGLLLSTVDYIISNEIYTELYLTLSYATLSSNVCVLTEIEVFSKPHDTLPSINVHDIITTHCFLKNLKIFLTV